jgi:hypothetical protein
MVMKYVMMLCVGVMMLGCAVENGESVEVTRQGESIGDKPQEGIGKHCGEDGEGGDPCMVAPDDGITDVWVHGSPRPTVPIVWTDPGGGSEPPPPPDQNPCLGPPSGGGGGCTPVPPEDSGEEDQEEQRRQREAWLNACRAAVVSSTVWGGFCSVVRQTYGDAMFAMCQRQHMTTEQAKRNWCFRYWGE